MEWRIKQLFRWHFGAVELFQMGPMAMQEGRFPSIWHRVYTWEACTYFFQAAAAQVFLLMPAIYCFTWDPPFNTHKTEFVMFLVPYFITAILPTSMDGYFICTALCINTSNLEKNSKSNYFN